MTMKRVSELITTNEIKKWSDNEVITITAGTGAGKSYFIKNVLYAFAKLNEKKILFLVHRSNCANQFKEEIEKDNKADTIIIKTYQYYESMIKNKKPIDLSEYKYIVADEFHYFLSDSSFNIITDTSLNLILNANSIKILMSATGSDIKNYIKTRKNINTIDYKLPIKYKFIKALSFYSSDNTLDTFAKDCIASSEDKGIFFIQSAKKAYEFYIKYKDNAIFNCSKSNKDYYKYVDINKIDDMLRNERFESKMLITTTCMDAGVNIIDKDVRHIVCDVKDTGTLIQCLGRKRLCKDEQIYVYIKSISNKSLGGIKGQLNVKFNKANYLMTHTVKEYLKEYPRSNAKDYYNLVYDDITDSDDKCTKRINELMYCKIVCDLSEIDTMLQYGKYGYNKYMNEEIFKRSKRYTLLEEDFKMSKLELYLDSVVDKKLFKEEQQELIEMFNIRDNRNRLQKSPKLFNVYLEDNKFPYLIINKQIRIENKRKTVWIVSKLILEK